MDEYLVRTIFAELEQDARLDMGIVESEPIPLSWHGNPAGITFGLSYELSDGIPVYICNLFVDGEYVNIDGEYPDAADCAKAIIETCDRNIGWETKL